MKTVLFLGAGYSAKAAVLAARSAGWRTIGTTRDPAKLAELESLGCSGLLFDGVTASPDLVSAASKADAIVVSIAPPRDGAGGDPVLAALGDTLRSSHNLRHVCYLSTIGVYGDFAGAWIDETAPTEPSSARGRARVAAEAAWLAAADQAQGWRVQIFRLAGIYGPGRSPIDRVRNGTSRAIIKPGQVFNRIHVADIASAIMAGLDGAGRHAIYNVVDDEPAAPETVIFHAADLIGVPHPPSIPFETADLTQMARSFYSDVKRVRNDRLRGDLGVVLTYPTYREGLAAIVSAESA